MCGSFSVGEMGRMDLGPRGKGRYSREALHGKRPGGWNAELGVVVEIRLAE